MAFMGNINYIPMPNVAPPRRERSWESMYKEQKWQNEQLLRELSTLREYALKGIRSRDELK